MAKYILTEIERNADDYEYNEEFDNHEDAQNKMMEYYHDLVNPSYKVLIANAEFSDNSAMVELTDGNVVEWDIKEVTD